LHKIKKLPKAISQQKTTWLSHPGSSLVNPRLKVRVAGDLVDAIRREEQSLQNAGKGEFKKLPPMLLIS